MKQSAEDVFLERSVNMMTADYEFYVFKI